MQNENSKVIEIKRAQKFAHMNQNDPSVQTYISDSKISIGAYWESANRKRSATGLTKEETKLLLPDLIGVGPDDGVKLWNDAVEDFYASINTILPVKLEVGLERDNNQPPSKGNMPIDLEDYIKYRHAIKHPATALTAAEGSLPMKDYLVVDNAKDRSVLLAENELADKASAIYLEVKDDIKKVKQILCVVNRIHKNYEDTEAKLAVSELSKKQPKEFIEAANDQHLAVKNFIFNLVHYKLVIKEGDYYMIAGTGDQIGNTLLEACLWAKSPESAATVTQLQLKLKELGRPENSKVIVEEVK